MLTTNPGLALSGGVDSMALTLLCHGLNSDILQQSRFDFKAFIVDHKVRDKSREEANLVAESVRKYFGTHINVCLSDELTHLIGIKAIVLPLEWPLGTQPSNLPNFESEARRLRYRALGRACKDHGIQRLLLAHHQDDQAENILLRLRGGHMHMGLQGMKESSQIPECYEIHGVGQSGGQDLLELDQLEGGSPSGLRLSGSRQGKKPRYNIGLENGGVTVHRPLLPFPKRRLIDTCLYCGIEWFEDKTNSDVTITPRNTIRHLLTSDRLPIALRKPSLLALADISRKKVGDAESCTEVIFNGVKFITLDLRSGRLLVQIPSVLRFSGSYDDEPRKASSIHDRRLIVLLLRRLIELVSPHEEITLPSVSSVASIVFPDEPEISPAADNEGKENLNIDNDDSSSHQASPTKSVARSGATAGGVQFRRVGPYWELNREPYITRNGESLPIFTFPPAQYVNQSPSNFHLWDGRYWIQVQNKTSDALVLRPLEESDIKPFLASLREDEVEKFTNLLKETAPGKTRFTLPALVTVRKSWKGEEGRSKVIAMPTLNVRAQSKEWDNVKWEVRYKHIRLGKGKSRVIIR